jgi:carboxymethylenebutenolidase
MQPAWSNYTGKYALVHASEEDGTSAAPGVKAAVAAIEEAGGEVEVHDYPGTHHAFYNDQRPEVHDPVSAQAAFDRTVEFLHERLG